MRVTRLTGAAAGILLALWPVAGRAQFTTPYVTTAPNSVSTSLGSTIVINQGLVGVGRLPASTLDGFVPAETFGSISGLQVTGWTRNPDGSFSGTFNILPDRGYNAGSFYSDYAARIYRIGFAFTPYTNMANIGGTTFAEKIARQNQIVFTTGLSGVKFTYADPLAGDVRFTTGLDPAGQFATLFGATVPYVASYTGPQTPASVSNTIFPGINKLAIDAEGLILKSDGSGYFSDEYGGYVYYFNSAQQIVGVIVPPAALQPHLPAGVPFFGAGSTPANGRRNNQGLEGVALSPDGTRLFVLLQSATIQDSDGNAQNRRQTRLLVYDVSTTATPSNPIGEYALTLPTYRSTGNGQAVNATAAQSEIVALDKTRLLVLARDGNGLGNSGTNPSVVKLVLLVDVTVGSPTNFASDAARNAEGGTITAVPGVLAPDIRPLAAAEVINMLNSTQLGKFNIALDTGGASQVSQLTLGEKWEGFALVPAKDPGRPNDYFLFVGNDNDFLTSTGSIRGPDGTMVSFDGFEGYPANRLPANAGPGNVNANDTMFLVYRVTIVSGIGIEARAAGAQLAVPVHFSYLNPAPAGGTLASPFALAPTANTTLVLDAPFTTSVNGSVYRFAGWQTPNGTSSSTSTNWPVNGPVVLTALYEQIPALTISFQAINLLTGTVVPALLNVTQPAIGNVPFPHTLARAPYEPLTVTTPPLVGTCRFRDWFNPASSQTIGGTTLNGNVTTSQTWVARYLCQ